MSNSAGDKIGQTIKGVLNVGHGAGESIRGNINAALDGAGEGLRHGTTHDQSSNNNNTAATERDEVALGKSTDYNGNKDQHDVAHKGNNEFKQGLDDLAGVFGKNKTTNTTNTTNNI